MALLPILREPVVRGITIARTIAPRIPQLPPVPDEAKNLLRIAQPVILAFSMEMRRRELEQKIKNAPKQNHPDTIANHFEDKRQELVYQRSKAIDVASSTTSYPTNTNFYEDSVTLIDIDFHGINQGIKEIKLPFIPKELNWNSESSFVGIKSVGRNNAKYHFTGSEDHLEFEIDWHSFDIGRADVIKNCRLLESLSKSDGYKRPPHRVILQWGRDDILFRDIVFIVTAAPYRLTQFNKAQILNGNIRTTALLPIQAYQKVTLARITDSNLTSEQIRLVHNY